MVIEIKGKRLRVRVARAIKGAKYRTDDVGTKGHSERIAMYNPRTRRWKTQSWTFPVEDIRQNRKKTVDILRKLSAVTEARKLAGVV